MVYFDVIWKYRQGGRGCLYTVPRESEYRFKEGRFQCDRGFKGQKRGHAGTKSGEVQGQQIGEVQGQQIGEVQGQQIGEVQGQQSGEVQGQ